jgi:CRP-like cAMP-binding protein
MVTVPLADGDRPAVATIGHRGLVGIPALLGLERSLHEVSWCISGNALRIRSMDLFPAAMPFSMLVQVLAAYAEMRLTVMEQNAACSGRHDVLARSARWLLTLSEDADSDRLALTHEALALMLGVSRQSMSLALASLRVDRKISYAAGRIVIIDRGGLEGASCECYAIVRSESERVLRSLVT